MRFIRLKLPPRTYDQLKSTFLKKGVSPEVKKHLRNNKELCKSIAVKLNKYLNEISPKKLKLKKIPFSNIYRAFFNNGQPPYNGATIFELDGICKYISENPDMTFFNFLDITSTKDVKEYVIPFYKNHKINSLDDLYEPIIYKPKTSENIQDINDRSGDALSALLSVDEAKTLKESQKQGYYDLILNNEIQIKSINRVERIFVNGDFEYIELKNIYVNRSIQKVILNRLIEADNNFTILVEGEAGRGKTSLLWFLHTHLNDKSHSKNYNFFPLYIKSSEFRSNSKKDIINQIIIASNYIKKENRKSLLLLIDTIDLLLQEEKEITNLEVKFAKLSLAGISIICTSRMQEATLLKSRITPTSIQLGDYNETEVNEAIKKYTNRYVHKFEDEELEIEFKRIKELVDKGFPIKEVCYNPLTLRMLYSIYVPNKIPNNVNVHQLYIEYWNKRVEKDFRIGIDDIDDYKKAGILPKKGKDINLGQVTFYICVLMLYNGDIEIEEQELLNILNSKQIDDHHFILLKNRDIIKQNGSKLFFFHQTFFEFAAAKTIVAVNSDNGLDLFKARIKEKPNNLFLLPIYEQLLLLSENHFVNKYKIPTEVTSLMKSQYISENHSGLYVFSFLNNVSEDFNKTFISLLIEKNIFIPKYFQLLPNSNKSRLPHIFENINNLNLEIDGFNINNHYIDLIYRFASYSPHLVKEFVINNEITRSVLKGELKSDRKEKYIKVIGKLQEYFFQWTLNEFSILLLGFKTNSKYQSKVLSEFHQNLVKRNTENFPNPASYFLEKISNQFNTSREIASDPILHSFAHLWIYEWKYGREEVVFELCLKTLNENNKLEFETKLFALAKVVIESTHTDISNLIEYYFSTSIQGKIVWARNFMFNILYESNNPSSKSLNQLILFIQNVLLDKYKLESYDNDLKGLTSAFKQRNKFLPNLVYKYIFSSQEFDSSQFWIDNKIKFIDFIAPCYFADCNGVTAIIDIILNQVKDPHYSKVITTINGYIGNLIHRNSEISEKVVQLLKYYKKLPSTINMVNKMNSNQLIENLENLDKIRIELLDSPNDINIIKGLEISIKLLEEGLIKTPSIELVRKLQAKTNGNHSVLEKLFKIQASWGEQSSFEEAKVFFETNLKKLSDEVKDSCFDIYLDLLLSSESYIMGNLDTIISLVLTKASNNQYTKDRLSKIKIVLKLLIKREHKNLFKIYANFLSRIETDHFNSAKSITHFSQLLKSIIFDISKRSSKSQLKNLITLTHSIPIPISKILLDSIYLQNLIDSNIRKQISSLHTKDEYHSQLKEHINLNERKLKVSLKSEKWMKLDKYLL